MLSITPVHLVQPMYKVTITQYNSYQHNLPVHTLAQHIFFYTRWPSISSRIYLPSKHPIAILSSPLLITPSHHITPSHPFSSSSFIHKAFDGLACDLT